MTSLCWDIPHVSEVRMNNYSSQSYPGCNSFIHAMLPLYIFLWKYASDEHRYHTGLKLENYYFFTFTFSWPEVGKLFLIYFFTFSWPEVGKLFLIYFFTFSWPEVGKLFLIYFFTFSRPEVGKLFRIYVFLDLNLKNYSIFRWLSARLQKLQRISNGVTAVLH